MLHMLDLDLRGKRVLIREDFNVPIHNGVVGTLTRLRATLPTLRAALSQDAKVILLSHLGRPKEGFFSSEFSLALVAKSLSELLGQPVRLASNWLDSVECAYGEVVLCENTRFNVGEKANNQTLARRMAALCDVFVMDAFGVAHRAEASTHGVARFAPIACAGPLLVSELESLQRGLAKPALPLVAIVGGSKVSTKLTVLENLLEKVDQLIVGGGIANTFLAATGVPMGKSLYEPEMLEMAHGLLSRAEQRGVKIPLPTDVVVAREFSSSAAATVRDVNTVAADELILDIGPHTSKQFAEILQSAGTILWNGPVGVFEFDQFGEGTRIIAEAVAISPAFSLAGGGETLAAIEKYHVQQGISYISSGGGAFLEFVEGKTLPAVAMLEQRASELVSL